MNVLTLFAKEPIAGEAKTRLARSVGPQHAQDVAAALLTDALELTRRVAERETPSVDVIIAYAPDRPQTRMYFEERAFGLPLRPQGDGDLGERMAGLFAEVFAEGAARVVAIGGDTPTLSAAHVAEAFARLAAADLVLSPAADGGYAMIGLSAPQPSLFQKISWGTADVLSQTISVAREAGLAIELLPMHCDVDTVEDLRSVYGQLDAALAPMTDCGQATFWTLQDLLSRPLLNPPPAEVRHFDEIEPVDCPCGSARRAWVDAADFPATVHRTTISWDSRPHVHRGQTECYVVLDCGPDAAVELDGQRHPVRVGSTVLIRPGCVHRAVGPMEVLILCVPKFDPRDEFESPADVPSGGHALDHGKATG